MGARYTSRPVGALRNSLLPRVLLFLALALLAYSLRALYAATVAGLDEGTYLAVGMLVAQGKTVYRDVFEAKPPLFHLINTGSYMLFGSNISLARLPLVLVTAATGLGVYEIARGLCRRPWPVVGALLLTAAASSPWLEGFWVMTEPYSALATVFGLLLLIRASQKGGWVYPVMAGACFGVALMVRQVAVLSLGMGVLWLVAVRWRQGRSPLRDLAGLAAGGLGVGLPVLLYLMAQGILGDFLYWVTGPLHSLYIQQEIPYTEKLGWGLDVLRATAPMWVLAAFFALGRMRSQHMLLVAVAGGLLVAFLMPRIAAYHHYYYDLLPAVAVLAAVGGANLVEAGGRMLLVGVAVALLLAMIVAGASNAALARDFRAEEGLPLAAEVAGSLREATRPGEAIFVFETAWPKLGPYIYFLSQRRPPLENLFFFTLFMPPEDEARTIAALESERVSQVVLIGHRPRAAGTRLYGYLRFHYQPVTTFAHSYNAYPWAKGQPVTLLQRRSGPIARLTMDGFEGPGRQPSWELGTSNSPLPSVTAAHSPERRMEGGSALKVRYSFPQPGGWVSLKREFRQSQDWAAYPGAALSFYLWGDGSGNLFQVHLVDRQSRASTFALPLSFSGWQHFVVPLTPEFFPRAGWAPGPADLSRLTAITLAVDGPRASTGTIFVDDLSLAYRPGGG